MTQPTVSQAVTFVPEDNSDWDHARNRRFALRAPRAEWAASSLSDVRDNGFVSPRNDFSYEGLLHLVAGENWKFMDRLEFEVRDGETPIVWTPAGVAVTPEVVTYRYSGAPGELSVRYALITDPDGAHAALSVRFDFKGKAEGLQLRLRPILDIRHMYRGSRPDALTTQLAEDRRLVFGADGRVLAIGAPTPWHYAAESENVTLTYALGRGEREGQSGQVVFKQETFTGVAPGIVAFDFAQAVAVAFAAGSTEAEVLQRLETLEAAPAHLESQIERLQGYYERYPKQNPEVVQRVYVMAEKFGMPVGGVRLPESGGWWFRTPGLRDVFDGFLHNHQTLYALGKGHMIDDALRLALRHQDPVTGRLPNRVPDREEGPMPEGALSSEYYEGGDPFLSMFTLVGEVLPKLQDESLVASLWAGFQRTFNACKASRLNQRQGMPVLLENGLLLAVPSDGWMSGKRIVWAEGITVTDLPIRVPMTWQVQDILHFRDAHYSWDQYQYPTYYLPELNAQWLRTLELASSLAERFKDAALAEELRQIEAIAIGSYKGVFWNPHTKSLYNLVTLDRRIDGMPTAPAIEAAALLGEKIFSRLELEQIWALARNRLLAKRSLNGEMAAFGLVAKDAPERVFYDNQQYHEAVVWPRVTPYLIRLLRALGQRATVQELLLTNLGHQNDEAVVFYNNEMLSLPEGVNPSPNPKTERNPVPVKNPMQWASQWCDPYLFES